MNTPLIKAAPPAVVESSKCRCTFAQKMVGDGCRYCNPQEYIDRLHDRVEDAEADAARYRWLRRKFCLTGNGDGTCAMQAINLPAAMPGWPEPGDVETFCDAAIDAARTNEGEAP